MAYYVYKITNKENGNWYIGKRKHTTPYTDKYMGSGKLIKVAIEKHGAQSFTKDIIAVFDTDEAAALLEASLVTKDTIRSSKSYNMHEGGMGGFGHLNDGGPDHIERVKSASKLGYAAALKTGKLNQGFSPEARERGKLAIAQSRIDNPELWAERNKKRSISGYGTNNSMFGRIWITNSVGRKRVILASEYSNFKINGWLDASDRREIESKVMKRRWVHKNNKNSLVNAEDYHALLSDGYLPGRINNGVNAY